MRALVIAFMLAGCAALPEIATPDLSPDAIADRVIAPADTPAQRVYRVCAIARTASEHVALYVRQPTAVPGVATGLLTAERAAYNGCKSAYAAAATFGTHDALVPSFIGFASAVSTIALQIYGDQPSVPLPGISATPVYIIAKAASIMMQAFTVRAQFADLKTHMAAMTALGRDPSQAEWDTLMASVDAAHTSTQIRA